MVHVISGGCCYRAGGELLVKDAAVGSGIAPHYGGLHLAYTSEAEGHRGAYLKIDIGGDFTTVAGKILNSNLGCSALETKDRGPVDSCAVIGAPVETRREKGMRCH